MVRCLNAIVVLSKTHVHLRHARPETMIRARRFDASTAWRRASAMIAANRDLLLAVAGAFFMLPALASSLFVPEPPAGADQAGEAVLRIYAAWWPLLVTVLLIQLVGQLGIFALLGRSDRPTVRGALGTAMRALPPAFAAQLLLAAGTGLGFLVMAMIAALSGQQALATLVLLPAFIATVWVFLRCMMATPIIAIAGERNPFSALQRSWRLTRGHAGRLFGFFTLLIGTGVIAYLALVNVTGALLALIAPIDIARIGTAVVGAIGSAALTLIIAAALAAAYDQLRAP